MYPYSAIILAGGKSSRMGKNKALLELQGKTVIKNIIDLLKKKFSKIIVVTKDIIPEKGPMGGLYTGLSSSKTSWNFVVSCDIPFIKEKDIDLIASKISHNYDCFVGETARGIEPLFAFYSKRIIPDMKSAINMNRLSLNELINSIKAKKILMDNIFNMNTPEDYKKAKELLNAF